MKLILDNYVADRNAIVELKVFLSSCAKLAIDVVECEVTKILVNEEYFKKFRKNIFQKLIESKPTIKLISALSS